MQSESKGVDAGTVQLYSGRMFNPLAPDPELITIEDIAHAGAYMCRFGGHVKKFYSVNEHAVHVSCMLEMWGYPPEVQLQGLLHDADEALGLPDLPRPVKNFIPDYRNAGVRIQQAVWKRFGLTWPMDEGVHVADNSILYLYEHPKLMPGNDEEWNYSGKLKEANIFIPCWQPDKAKYMFMQRYNFLMKRINEQRT